MSRGTLGEFDKKTETEQFAWAVGLLEGEGTIFSKAEHGKRGQRCVALTSTDSDVVDRFAIVVGVGNVTGPYVQKEMYGRKRKPFWRWQCSAWDEVEPLLVRMLPFLCRRRKAAAMLLLSRPSRPYRLEVACGRGHPRSKENVRINKNGARQCLVCVRLTRDSARVTQGEDD